MQPQIVSITSSGQLTVPKRYREKLGIGKKGAKAVIKVENNTLVVEPRLSFDQLSGSLAGKIKLSDKELGKARQAFEKNWSNERRNS